MRDFALEAAAQGHRVRVLTQSRAGEVVVDPSIEVRRYEWTGDRPLSTLQVTNPVDWVAMLTVVRNGRRALKDWVRSSRPDLVLSMWAVPGGWLAQAVESNVPYAVWTLGSDIWVYGRRRATRGRVRKVLRGASRLFSDGMSLSEETAQLAGRPCEFVPSTRRLPLGLDRPIELEHGYRHFVYIGRFHPHKGVDLLVDAVELLRSEETQGLRFHLFGGGAMESEIRDRIRSAQLEETVRLHGYADRTVAAAFLEHADVAVIPSRIESIPVILSDAAQAGCPILATNVGDMGSVLRNHGGGHVVEANAVGLSEGIRVMAKAARSEFVEGLERLRREFALDSIVRTVLDDEPRLDVLPSIEGR